MLYKPFFTSNPQSQSLHKYDKTERASKRTRQKSERGHKKEESNVSLKIPDRRGTPHNLHPQPPFGGGDTRNRKLMGSVWYHQHETRHTHVCLERQSGLRCILDLSPDSFHGGTCTYKWTSSQIRGSPVGEEHTSVTITHIQLCH